MRMQKEQSVNPPRMILSALGAAALVVVMASCATVNRLETHDFQGASLAAHMRTPPEPQMDIRYDVTLDSHNPIYSALSVMTNLAKAAQAEKARNTMREALLSVDLPGIIRDESFSACAFALGTEQVDRTAQSDYLLDMEIRDWGIEASSPTSAVMLRVRLTASLYKTEGRELLWQREVRVRNPASAGMFGVGQVIGNMVTATVLSNMTADELAQGFTELGRESARTVVRQLERDMDRARAY
jgi:ABC-type uncharacterized transport system auxiliary subunit